MLGRSPEHSQKSLDLTSFRGVTEAVTTCDWAELKAGLWIFPRMFVQIKLCPLGAAFYLNYHSVKPDVFKMYQVEITSS